MCVCGSDKKEKRSAVTTRQRGKQRLCWTERWPRLNSKISAQGRTTPTITRLSSGKCFKIRTEKNTVNRNYQHKRVQLYILMIGYPNIESSPLEPLL